MTNAQIPSAKSLFLIDGIGALLSAFSLGVILPRFQSIFGMPTSTLYFLAAIALAFAFYSLTCHFLFPVRWRPYLLSIALANSAYALLTTGLIFYSYNQLTPWALAYFFGELVVIGILVRYEIRRVNLVSSK